MKVFCLTDYGDGMTISVNLPICCMCGESFETRVYLPTTEENTFICMHCCIEEVVQA